MKRVYNAQIMWRPKSLGNCDQVIPRPKCFGVPAQMMPPNDFGINKHTHPTNLIYDDPVKPRWEQQQYIPLIRADILLTRN